jgi:hypothetical protein
MQDFLAMNVLLQVPAQAFESRRIAPCRAAVEEYDLSQGS